MVVDSRRSEDSTTIRRRRECSECATRWSTIEIPEKQYNKLKQLEVEKRLPASERFRSILRRTIIDLERLEQRVATDAETPAAHKGE